MPLLDRGAGPNLDAVAAVNVRVDLTHVAAERAPERHWERLHDQHFLAELTRRGSDLSSDEACPDQQESSRAPERFSQRLAVMQRSQGAYVFGTWHIRQPPRGSAQTEDQEIECDVSGA